MRILTFGTTLATLSSVVKAGNEASLGDFRVSGSNLLHDQSNIPVQSPSNRTARSTSILSQLNRYVTTKIRRQESPNVDGQCGEKDGSCAKGYCCSPEVSDADYLQIQPYTDFKGLVWDR
jgi:hypothetical protein